MSQPNINTPNSDLVSSLSQSQSYLSPNFLVILPGLTSSVRLCGVERCPAQQSEEEEEVVCNFGDPSFNNKREIEPQPKMQKHRLSV